MHRFLQSLVVGVLLALPGSASAQSLPTATPAPSGDIVILNRHYTLLPNCLATAAIEASAQTTSGATVDALLLIPGSDGLTVAPKKGIPATGALAKAKPGDSVCLQAVEAGS